MRNEAWRPSVHFTPDRNWINDPNGLVWFDGEYHLFYQHNPFGNDWGHMSWGHAVSNDLLHWHELPVAIAEDERVSIFSGSVVVDEHDTSGLAGPGQTALVAAYTGCLRQPTGGQAQEIAYSTDRGRTFTPYAHNPVVDLGLRDFRDPKVFWHAPTARWVMAVVLPHEHQILFFASTDLKAWRELGRFGPAGEAVGIWECPDLFEVPIEGEDGRLTGERRWLLKVDSFSGHPGGTGAQVFIGHFDGMRFVEDRDAAPAPRWVDHGSDFYAALSWNHLPPSHDRPVWLGWMSNHRYAGKLPTTPWRGAMSLPRELSLRHTSGGLRLVQRPLAALAGLRAEPIDRAPSSLHDERIELPVRGRALELQFSIASLSAGEAGLEVLCGEGQATRVGYDAEAQAVFIDRSRSGTVPEGDAHFAGRRLAPVRPPSPDRPLDLQLFVDAGSVELFADKGLAVITELVLPAAGHDGVAAFASGGRAAFGTTTAWPLARCMP
ncbi:MAG: glycoside hydrolase family 32 protein [Ideonella sp.]|nr:glycoside hydrolase family 32 protein [Ideonella sp.]